MENMNDPGPEEQAPMGGNPPASPPAAGGGLSQENERLLALIMHLSMIAGFFVPFTNIIIPLVIWLLKKDESQYIDVHGKEVVNFQISLLIYLMISGVLTIVLIGIIGLVGFSIFGLIVAIMGGIKAYNGEYYQYPLCIRLIK